MTKPRRSTTRCSTARGTPRSARSSVKGHRKGGTTPSVPSELPRFQAAPSSSQGSRPKKGHLIGLDGRQLPVRSDHAALNTPCNQRGVGLQEVDRTDRRRTYETELDARIIAWVHDEVHRDEGDGDHVGRITRRMAKKLAESSTSQSQRRRIPDRKAAGPNSPTMTTPALRVFVARQSARMGNCSPPKATSLVLRPTRSPFAPARADQHGGEAGTYSNVWMITSKAWSRWRRWMSLALDTDILLYRAPVQRRRRLTGDDVSVALV